MPQKIKSTDKLWQYSRNFLIKNIFDFPLINLNGEIITKNTEFGIWHGSENTWSTFCMVNIPIFVRVHKQVIILALLY